MKKKLAIVLSSIAILTVGGVAVAVNMPNEPEQPQTQEIKVEAVRPTPVEVEEKAASEEVVQATPPYAAPATQQEQQPPTCPSEVQSELDYLMPKKAEHDAWMAESRQLAVQGLEYRGEEVTEEKIQKLMWARSVHKYQMANAVYDRINTLKSSSQGC